MLFLMLIKLLLPIRRMGFSFRGESGFNSVYGFLGNFE